MDDKKINLLPEDLRSKEDKTKRSTLTFNPDFKLPGKKQKSLAYEPSGSRVSWWSKMFKGNSKHVKAPEPVVPKANPFAPSISYNDSSPTSQSKSESITMRVPEKLPAKVEEHIKDFVPAQAKVVKIKGPSFWSKIAAMFKSKPRPKKLDNSALANGLKYNGNALHQPESKADIKILQEFNKQAEEADNLSMKPPKISDQVTGTVKPEPIFDITKKVNEEINLAPLQPITPSPQLPDLDDKSSINSFTMPEFAPKVENPEPIPVPTPIPTPVPIPTPLPTQVAPIASVDQVNHKVTGPKFHMPEPGQKNSLMNGGVDLIPIAARVRSWKQIGSLLIFAIVLSVSIIGFIYVYLVYDQQRIVGKQNEQKQRIAEIEKNILTFSELNKNISNLGQEIRLVQDALNKHIYWTNFFRLLERYTVSDVYYAGLAVGNNGGLTLNATTNSYDSVAKQLKVFNSENAKEFVNEASITSAKQNSDGAVSFQINLSLNQSLFYYSQTK